MKDEKTHFVMISSDNKIVGGGPINLLWNWVLKIAGLKAETVTEESFNKIFSEEIKEENISEN